MNHLKLDQNDKLKKLAADAANELGLRIIKEKTGYSYGDYQITFEGLGWSFVHEWYDGAEDAEDYRCGMSLTLEGCVDQIRDLIAEEMTEQEITQIESDFIKKELL